MFIYLSMIKKNEKLDVQYFIFPRAFKIIILENLQPLIKNVKTVWGMNYRSTGWYELKD